MNKGRNSTTDYTDGTDRTDNGFSYPCYQCNPWCFLSSFCLYLALSARPSAFDSEAVGPGTMLFDIPECRVGRIAKLRSPDASEARNVKLQLDGFVVPHPEMSGIAQPEDDETLEVSRSRFVAKVGVLHEGRGCIREGSLRYRFA